LRIVDFAFEELNLDLGRYDVEECAVTRPEQFNPQRRYGYKLTPAGNEAVEAITKAVAAQLSKAGSQVADRKESSLVKVEELSA
jgi:hypothetical protein